VGSLLRYNPGTEETINSGLNSPQAMVVDAGNNIYIADTQNGVLKKFVWTGSSYDAPVDVGAWTQPTGVAVDGAGNLFVTDQITNKLSEVPWTGSGYGTQVVISSAYTSPQDVAIDGSGDLYVLSSASTISKLPWNGTGYGTATTIGSGFSGSEFNTAVVDNSGNVYVADCNNGTITKETYNGSIYTQATLLNYGTSNCIDGVAVDPAGDVYVADYNTGATGVVQLLPFTGSGYGSPITLTTTIALEGPEAIYLDGVGNIYIEDFTLNFVEKWSVTTLPTIVFPTHTNVGSEDTTDNPQSVSLLNIGNAPLSILPPEAGLNPSFAAGFTYANSSTCPQLTPSSGTATLDSGASCTYAVDFAPIAPGTDSGSFVLTDNYNGASSTTQKIFLSGTGVSTVSKLAFGTSPATPIGIGGNAGSAVTVDEELGSGAIATYGDDVITLKVTGPGGYSQVYPQAALSGVAAFDLGSVALNTSGTYTYTASLTGVSSAVASETVNSLTSQTITGFAPATPVTYGVVPITLTATGGGSGNPVTFSIISGPGTLSGTNNSMLTVNGAGTIVIAANQAGNTNYSAATQVTASILVNRAAQGITAFAPATPVIYGVSPITLAATGGASGNAVSFSIVSGPGTLSGTNNSTLTVTGAGTIVIAANQAGNTNYSAATQVTASIVVNPTSQSITFSPSTPVTYGVSPIMLTANGGASGNPVSFSIVSGPGTLSGTNNALLTVTGAGTIVIAASQAGNANYAAATQVTASMVVNQKAQTITFSPSTPVTYGTAPLTLTATGGASGDPVSFSLVSGPGTLSGTSNSTLTVTGAGTIMIAANQAGNTNYSAATQVTASIVINQAAQTVTGFAPATPVNFGVSPITLTATAGASGNPVTFSIVSGPGSLSGANNGTLTVTGAGTIVIAANQAGNANYTAATQVTASIVVSQTSQSITFSPATPVTYGAAPITLTATGGASGNPVSFSIVSGPGTLSGTNNSMLTVTGAGTIVIAANQAGNTNYTAATQVTASIVVNQKAQTITFSPSTPVTYGTPPITLTATGGASGNPVSFSIISGPGTLSGTNNSALAVTGAGTIVIAANQAGSANYSAATPVTSSIVVNQATQAIAAFAPATPVNFGVSPITLTATGGASGNPVTFSIVSGPGTLSGTNNNTLTVTGAGTIVIAANQAGNANYTAATQVTASIVVNQKAQTITFSPSTPVTYGAAPITLAATGGASGNAVTFSIVSGPGTLSGTNNNTLTVTGAGTIVIAANQAGNGSYAAAAQVTASIVVNSTSQSITFSPATPVTYGVTPITLAATGGASGNPVSFSILSGPGTLSGTNDAMVTVTGAGTLVIAANQAGNANYAAATQVTASIVVNQAAQAITFSPATPVTYGPSPIMLAASGGASGNPVSFSIVSGPGTLSGTNNSTLTATGAGTVVIAANQAGNANYSAATQVTASIVVNQKAQTITFAPTTPVTYGTVPITLTATGGTSGNPVSFSFVSGPGTLSGTNNSTLTVTGAGTIVIAANQSGNTNYSAATQVTANVVVSQATQAITAFAPATPVTYGISPIPLTVTGGGSGNPVTFSIVNGPGTLSGTSNSTLTVTGVGTIVIAANQAGNANYSAATQVTASIVVNQTSQSITFSPATPVTYGVTPITLTATGGASGNPVSFGILSGPGTLRGTNNSALTVMGAGTIVIAANQAGSSSYSAAAQVAASIVVNKAPLTVAVNPLTSIYGAAFPAFTGTVTGVVDGDGITATYSTTATPTSAAGTYSIVATLADPDSKLGNYAVTNTPAMLTITKALPLIGLASSVNPVLVLNPVTLTATLTGATMPTGSVSFLDGATPLGTAAVTNGMATLTVTTLTVGTHPIAAVYSGDTNFAAANSATPITEVVQDFSLAISTSSGSGSATALPGSTAAYSFTVSPTTGTTFPATVTLSASGLPSGATYTFSPATLAAGSGSSNVTLTVQLPSSTSADSAGKVDLNPAHKLAPVALALVLLPFAGRLRSAAKRMSLYVALMMLLGLSATAALSGCGAGGSGYFGQSPQTYTVTVTGTSGQLSHSTTVTLTVE
jgi:hypothetical protein